MEDLEENSNNNNPGGNQPLAPYPPQAQEPRSPGIGPDGKKDPMAGLTEKEKALMEEMKVTDWNEFTQNTTFHGVKYIFEDSPVKMRR